MLSAVVIVIILVAIYFVLQKIIPAEQVTQAQAAALIMSDLQNSYPNAVINITNVTPSRFRGSWHILASVIANATTPCPSYYAYSFDYPQYGFVYRVQNTYTSNCVIYGMQENNSYILSSYPVAIARSYNLTLPLVTNFVNAYGYRNVAANASFYSNYTVFGGRYNNVWLVGYGAPAANYSVYVLLTQIGGRPITDYTVRKS